MEKDKTEKIDVPQFEGWEAFYGRPGDHEGCRILSGDGDELVQICKGNEYVKDWPQICYRKIKPKRIVFETTGEFRPPREGEFYMSPMGDFEQAHNNYSNPRKICKKVEG